MKKIYFTLFLVFFPLSLWALDTPHIILNKYTPLPCSQIYFKKPLSPSSDTACKAEWNKYFKQATMTPDDYEANIILSIMLANGIGHSMDLTQAKIYADKTKNQTVIVKISQRLAWCDDLATITPEIARCAFLRNQDLANKFQNDMQLFSTKLSPREKNTWQKLINNLLNFIILDNLTRDLSHQFYGGTYESIRTASSVNIMLNFYIKSMDYFLHHFPENLQTKDSTATLNKELNLAYQHLLQEIKPNEAKEKLIETEKTWINLKNTWIDFADLYYRKKYAKDKITETISAYLTNRRIEELKAETKDYQEKVIERDQDEKFQREYLLKIKKHPRHE